MQSVDAQAGRSTPTRNDSQSADQMKALVIGTLDREPDATFDRVHAHLRSFEGRPLSTAETEQLRQLYQAELANPTGAHRVGAVEANQLEAHLPFRIRPYEIGAFFAALLPFGFPLGTTTPPTVVKATGVVTAPGGFYDLSAAVGGLLALMFCFYAVRQAVESSTRRAIHFTLIGLLVLAGLYQTLFGLGVLHRYGLISGS